MTRRSGSRDSLGDEKAIERVAVQRRQVCDRQDVFRPDLEQLETRALENCIDCVSCGHWREMCGDRAST